MKKIIKGIQRRTKESGKIFTPVFMENKNIKNDYTVYMGAKYKKSDFDKVK